MNNLGFKARRKSISLTALIDVVFILLMFFMLTSSFQHFNTVELSQSSGGGSAVEESKPRFLLLYADGSVRWSEDTVQWPLARVNGAFMAPAREATSMTLIPEHKVSVQQIITALEKVQALGFESVQLAEGVEKHD